MSLTRRTGRGFDDADWRQLSGLIETAAARRMHVALDPHQYGRPQMAVRRYFE